MVLRMAVLLVMAVIMIAAMTLAGFAQETEKECYLIGDTNNDGVFDDKDAHQALFTALLPEMYSIERDWDINKDQKQDQKDAIALLNAFLLPDIYPEYAHALDEVHDYFDPAWNWEENEGVVTATVTVQCACGKTDKLTAEVTLGEKVKPSCTETGSQVYEAVAVLENGKTFVGSYTQILPATGHTEGEHGFNENQHYVLCGNCEQEIQAASHQWKVDGAPSAATCQVAAVQNYVCDCGAAKQTELGKAQCDYVYLEGQDVAVAGEDCRFAKQYQCSVCGDVKQTDFYTKHNYIAVIRTEPSCTKTGLKVYECTHCHAVDETKTQVLEVIADQHSWNEGVTASGVTTYTCTEDGCGKTKTAVTAESGTVSKDAIEKADELKLDQGTSVTLGDTVKEELSNRVEESIQITVKPVEQGTLDALLSEEQKAQIKDITVYDFNMTVDGNSHTEFSGEITITLPYTLAEGEDADAIFIWYISDQGELDYIPATYSDGYVTFKTTHFSYYTVTRLTPAERCEKYGHIATTVTKAATCTATGYTKQVCQRCNAELSWTEIPEIGHDYAETSRTEATCETFGAVVEECRNCHHTKSQVTAALGHDLQLTDTVKATCSAAGYFMYTCQHDNCGKTYQEAIAQLTHDYQKDDSKTVAATCTAGGYDVYVCIHCGAWIKENETVALGHNYSNGTAVWNEDLLNPAVVLTCGNDGCSAEKALKANIFTKATSCLSGGSMEAIVSYNGITYRKVLSTEEAWGHQAGKDWLIDAEKNLHYHLCRNCNVRLDEATHNYNDGEVTVEPTCAETGEAVYTCKVCGNTKKEILPETGKHTYDEGTVTKEPTCVKAGVRTYTCTTCGKNVTEAIPATGEHNYVDGTCSDCGKTEGICDHSKTQDILFDVSGYDICEGFELYMTQCECGKIHGMVLKNVGCEFEEEEQEEEFSITQTMTCTKCGIVLKAGQGVEFTEAPCMAQYVEWAQVIIDGETVAAYELRPEQSREEHPAVLGSEKITVEHEGFCGMVLTYRTCPCGKAYSYKAEENCKWEYSDGIQTCAECGTVCKYTEESVKGENCLRTTSYAYAYYDKTGELFYSYDEVYIQTSHNTKLEDYELLGSSCEEGVRIWFTCVDCGATEEEYWENDHPMILETHKDLTGSGLCASTLVQAECPCGKEARDRLEGVQCQWQTVSYEETAIVQKCAVCGATRNSVMEQNKKDENCEIVYTQHITYQNAAGETVATSYARSYYTSHDYDMEWEMLGDSCEDGVIITYTCKDCGETYTEEIDYHEMVIYEETELYEYGLCGGWSYVESCICGKEMHSEIFTDCQWRYQEDGRSICRNCGTERVITTSKVPVSECETRIDEIHSFCRDGEELLNFKRVAYEDHHRWVYEFTLRDGSTSCATGYWFEQTCLTCGETQSGGGQSDGHYAYPTDREILSDIGLCGDVELLTCTCPCGKKTETQIRWIDQACRFEYYQAQEDGSVLEICAACGAQRRRISSTQPVEGESCMIAYCTLEIYLVDGEEVFRTNRVDYETAHKWEEKYTLLGESCEDGVSFSRTCTVCKESYSDIYYYHEPTHEEIDLAEYGLCGGYMYKHSCPCGEICEMDFHADCDWQWDEELSGENVNVYKCRVCETVWTEEIIRGETYDNCYYDLTVTNTFAVPGKDPLVAIRKTTGTTHSWKYSYELRGESCEDGVVAYMTCTKCGENNTREYYHHEQNDQQVYDLSKYGMCGGALIVNSCACGQQSDMSFDAEACSWDFVEGGEGYQIERCSGCGVLRKYSYGEGEKIGTCGYQTFRMYSYYQEDGTSLLNVVSTRVQMRHMEIYTLRLVEGATSCEEGYYITETCQNCGVSSEWVSSGDHMTYVTNREVISQDQICSDVYRVTWSCACQKVVRTEIELTGDDCSFRYDGFDSELGCDVFTCEKCGVVKHESESREPVEGSVCEYMATTTSTYIFDGRELFSLVNTNLRGDHRSVAVLTLLGKTCEEGYTVQWQCVDCGMSMGGSDSVEYGCRYYRVEMTRLAPESMGLCGDLYWVVNRCACGKEQNAHFDWENGQCDFEHICDDKTGELLYQQCRNCGVRFETTQTKTRVEGTTCDYVYTTVYTYIREGQDSVTVQTTSEGQEHREIAVYHLLGDSCEDGYTVTWKCVNCGYEATDDTVYTDHSERDIAIEVIIPAGDHVCGEVYNRERSCACGYQTSQWIEHSCSYSRTDNSEAEEYRCDNCGLRYVVQETQNRIPNSCLTEETEDRTYTTANGEVFTFHDERTEKHHIGIEEFTGDCETGYYVTQKCAYCKHVIWQSTEPAYGHTRYRVGYYSLQDLGMCGGAINHYSCACGESQQWGEDNRCNYQYTGNQNEDGAMEHICQTCGSVIYRKYQTEVYKEACYEETFFYFRLVRDGEVKLDLQKTFRTEYHTWLALDFQGTCEESVTVYLQCKYCKEQRTSYEEKNHTRYVTNYVDLTDLGCCGGYLEQSRCACGEYETTYISAYDCDWIWENDIHEQEDGGQTGMTLKTCSKCGLQVQEEWYDVKTEEPCRYERMVTGTATKEGTVIAHFEEQRYTTVHKYGQTQYTLQEGSETCEDGVICTDTCLICGNTSSWTSNSHNQGVVQTWDLTNYGSACGGKLERYACACGEYEFCQYSPDCGCDLDISDTELWITDAVNGQQQTTAGWVSLSSFAQMHTCAQTDPQCGLKIRRAEYWLVEDCWATKHEVWQLGYNAQTGECLEQIHIVYKNGCAFHDYETQRVTETLSDGTVVDKFIQTCKACQSTNTETTYTANNVLVRFEQESVNTKQNGEDIRKYQITEYAQFNDRNLITKTRLEETSADGNVYWVQNLYTYDFTKGCETTLNWSNSYGESKTEKITHHNTSNSSWWEKLPSCSQPGIWVEHAQCETCGEILKHDTTKKNHNGHNWQLNADGQGYTCQDCGLENANGADGIIILEDMTQDYGSSENYVVGYWNQGEEAFDVKISVVLDDGTEILLEKLQEVYLTVEADGIQALSISAQEVNAAVQEVAPGAEYDVRVTFVPADGSIAWDYAITMDRL